MGTFGASRKRSRRRSPAASKNRRLGASPSEEAAAALQRVRHAPAAAPRDIQILQRALGNQTVQRILATRQVSVPQPTIQRMRRNPADGHFYSGASPVLEETYKAEDENDAFLTATSALGTGGGHTAIYIEYLEGNRPRTIMTDLRVASKIGGSGASSQVASGGSGSTMENGSGSGKGHSKIAININELPPAAMAVDLATRPANAKKTWKTSRGNAEAGLAHAQEVQNKVQSAGGKKPYKYYLLGRGPAKGAMNCARFGQHILKNANIPIHLGFWKVPNKLTKRSKKDGHLEAAKSMSDIAGRKESKLPAEAQSRAALVAALTVQPPDGYAVDYDVIGKNLERYHIFPETLLRYHSLKQAVGMLVAIMQFKALSYEAGYRRGSYDDDTGIRFLKDQFVPGLNEEMGDFRQEVAEQLALESAGQDEQQEQAEPEAGVGLSGVLPKLDPMVAYITGLANETSGDLKQRLAERHAAREPEAGAEQAPAIDPDNMTAEQLMNTEEGFKID